MPVIDPSLIPSVNPGSLFSRFTVDPSISVRWFVPVDPVTHTVLNRPIGDIALRQLILAKTIDALNLRLGHQALFPFLVTAQVNNGTQNVDIPPSWIWDMQVSLPQKWEKVRLARLKRLSGTNIDSNNTEYTGAIRLIFTAQEQGSVNEISIFQADFQIDSTLTYQIARVITPPPGSEPIVILPGETETVGGFVTFRTLDATDSGVQTFYNVITPPVDPTAVDSNGFFLDPVVIEINDSVPGGTGVVGDFDFAAVAHGTGLLTLSAYNPIPAVDSTIGTWLSTFNYPYDSGATLQSSNATGVVIPVGLFKEFNILAPASDEPNGDLSGSFFPVYVNRIERLDPTADTLKFFFSTFNVEVPSIVPIEFATLTITRVMTPGTIVSIVPEADLFQNQTGANWMQGFGKGHVSLSNLWSTSSTVITDFFDVFKPIIDEPAQAVFAKEATRISSYGLSRAAKYTPTAGQAAALRGSRSGSSDPEEANRYIVEADQGLGDQVDFATSTTLPEDSRENPDIERFGFTGSLAHHVVSMVMNTDGKNHNYDDDILPRLRLLLGRDPGFGDFWWDGTVLKFFNGDTWIG